jgi:hypothetical protein
MIIEAHDFDAFVKANCSDKILGSNISINLDYLKLKDAPFDCLLPLNHDFFPGHVQFFMDFLLIEGKAGYLDYSVLLPHEKNFNVAYDLYLNLGQSSTMSIRQLYNRDLLYILDGMTNKYEFCWLILEKENVKGKPTPFSNGMRQLVFDWKLAAFQRLSSHTGKLDHKINASNVPKIAKNLDYETMQMFGKFFQEEFLKNSPDDWKEYKIYHLIEKHGQNETIYLSPSDLTALSNFSEYLAGRYGWESVNKFYFAWTLEVIFTSCDGCRANIDHSCFESGFSHFMSKNGKFYLLII